MTDLPNFGQVPTFQVGANYFDAHGGVSMAALARGLPVSGEAWTAAGLNADAFIVNKVGRNPDIDTSSDPEDVWEGGGLYTGFPTTGAATVSVVSTSAGDTGVLTIFGLDADWNVTTRTVTLNGLAPVVVPGGAMRRAHSASYNTGASGAFNLGAITVSMPGNVLLMMEAGRSQTNAAVYTIPAGYTGLMVSMAATVRTAVASEIDGDLWVREFGKSPRLRRPFAATNSAPFQSTIFGGLILTEKTDLSVRIATVFVNNTEVVASFDLLLSKNPV